jgi:hypothetical protein
MLATAIMRHMVPHGAIGRDGAPRGYNLRFATVCATVYFFINYFRFIFTQFRPGHSPRNRFSEFYSVFSGY